MSELYHHGVKGMKWGRRRYQNPDGTLTPAGKKRRTKLQRYADRDIADAAVIGVAGMVSGLGTVTIGSLMRRSDNNVVAFTGTLLQSIGKGSVAGNALSIPVAIGTKYIAQKKLLELPKDVGD